jgi:hypothetical protein
MVKVKAFFQSLKFILNIKFAFLKYRIKNRDFKRYRLSDRYTEVIDYLSKVLEDENYTYSDYKELLFYNHIKDSAEARGVSKETIIYEIVVAMILFS